MFENEFDENQRYARKKHPELFSLSFPHFCFDTYEILGWDQFFYAKADKADNNDNDKIPRAKKEH